jgi:hypothetical protein
VEASLKLKRAMAGAHLKGFASQSPPRLAVTADPRSWGFPLAAPLLVQLMLLLLQQMQLLLLLLLLAGDLSFSAQGLSSAAAVHDVSGIRSSNCMTKLLYLRKKMSSNVGARAVSSDTRLDDDFGMIANRSRQWMTALSTWPIFRSFPRVPSSSRKLKPQLSSLSVTPSARCCNLETGRSCEKNIFCASAISLLVSSALSRRGRSVETSKLLVEEPSSTVGSQLEEEVSSVKPKRCTMIQRLLYKAGQVAAKPGRSDNATSAGISSNGQVAAAA